MIFDKDNEYWSMLRRQHAFVPAWNSALWECAKLVLETYPQSMERTQLLKEISYLALKPEKRR